MQHDLRAIYDRDFSAEQIDGTARSARFVVPVVMKLMRDLHSVVDVGCGSGVWLASFKDVGVERVLGLDGVAAEKQGRLEIEPDEFHAANLECDIDVDERFDLCLCLEVAQHLADQSATTLVRNICELSDVILFSAAIPGEGGGCHINERWPSYWIDLFSAAGYEVLDIIRGRVWNDARVEWRYRQNLLFFANKAGLSRIVRLPATVASTPLDIVHPACFEQYCRFDNEEMIYQLERRNAHLESELLSVLNSTSWKLTWPLRRAIGDDENRRRKFRALARIGWWLVSAKFFRTTLASRALRTGNEGRV
jgi:SAM-dependent methyltransferase